MLIAHISDPHVTTEGTFIRSVVDTPGRLIAAFETLRDLPRAPDVIVITGDLVNDATPAEYELLVEATTPPPAGCARRSRRSTPISPLRPSTTRTNRRISRSMRGRFAWSRSTRRGAGWSRGR